MNNLDSRILYGYKAILKKFYGLDLKVDLPINLSFLNRDNGLERYFKFTANSSFLDVHHLEPLPKLEESNIRKLLDVKFDLALWMEILPPENFLFSGSAFVTLVDTTTEEASRNLQFALLNREEIFEEAIWFETTQQEIRNLFRLPKIRLGIATVQHNGQLDFTSKKKIWNSLLIKELTESPQEYIENSIYQQVLQNGETLIIKNLKKEKEKENKLAKNIVKMGFQNLLLTPLYSNERIIGILELASPSPGAIDGLSMFKVNQVKPIFGYALKRHLEEFENMVEAEMLEEFTTIHPSIQWRFREAAINKLNKSVLDENIIFENIYPIYGSLDIRDSSKKRNKAIYLDLLENLEFIGNLLRKAFDILSLDILEELLLQVQQKIEKLQSQLSTEDEAGLAEYIRRKINPVIQHLGERYSEFSPMAEQYKSRINIESGIFGSNRINYDVALKKLNSSIANILDEEEEELQKTVPCYYEKYLTDGVEYNIYLGQSIAPQIPFDDLYIENVRL